MYRGSEVSMHAVMDLTLGGSARTRASAVIQRFSRVIQQFSRWWRDDSEERYLSRATDHADLERRQRALERGRGRPSFDMTFNF
jgi:hypothetical protein